MISKCQSCGKEKLLVADVSAAGAYGPNLLPGTGLFVSAKFNIVICSNCGFVHWYVRSQDIEKVKKSKKFKQQ